MKKPQNKPQTQNIDRTFGVVVDDEVFPFLMTSDQVDSYLKLIEGNNNHPEICKNYTKD